MNKLFSMTLVAALLLSGCSFPAARTEAPGPSAAATGLYPPPARITDSRILADRQTLDQVQQRLRKLNEAGVPQNNYPLAKAQCWLDTAKTQYHENDRTGYIEESLTESVKIIQALEADKNARAGYDTPLVARSTKLRDDLWAQLAGYKDKESTLACTARTVACAEVRLVRAGHAEQQTGWRQATVHVQMVEDALRRASAEAASCPQPASAAPAVRAAPAAAAAVAAAAQPAGGVTKETFIILADTLFRFDKSGRDEMLPGGLQRLALIADRLKAYKSIESIAIVGHSDRLGSDEYNDKLSQTRADTVKAQLESLGIKAASVKAKGVGKREPVTKDCSEKSSREEQIQCLQPDRRVTIEVSGVVR
ncbi:OmpA family protein [Variovorax terrae]|uniref:OmpA family protein n=1 Tax=Variovorax terrae TaxID=2923278 RepID=A0A9X2AQM6_9BURK|nr:OmpA family protein [Variovorax terrae]MCJ0764722.1 OmpA family protein [Variovorax terrae]